MGSFGPEKANAPRLIARRLRQSLLVDWDSRGDVCKIEVVYTWWTMPVSVRRAALAVAIIFPALLVFFVRGPSRAFSDSSDFATVYAASRCWMFHENPYLHSS